MIGDMTHTRMPRKAIMTLSALFATGALTLTACSTGTDAEQTSAQRSVSQSAANTGSASEPQSSSTGDSTQTIAAAAKAAQEFIDTLDDEQREQVLYDFDDSSKSTSWSNFPVTFVERSGLKLGDLNEEQRAAALKVMEALLNDEAYETMINIMNGDQYLEDNTQSTDLGNTQYNIAFFGDPSDDGDWAIQYGGHHLGINATMSDGSITFAPTHLGMQPLSYKNEDGETVQTFGAIYEDAFAFFESLNEEQKHGLYQGEEPSRMECEPGSTCDFPTGTGLKGSELNEEQKNLLLELVRNWAGMADDAQWESTKNAIAASLDETYVNWSGETEYKTDEGNGIYFQISGPDVYVEFAAQDGSAGADAEGLVTSGWGHVHSIYRDPKNDYAGSVTQEESAGPGGGTGGPGGQNGSAPGDSAPGRNGSAPAGAPGGQPPADVPRREN